jgi:GcrA cell cycle regulator
MSTPSSWTEERVTTLAGLWREGLSAAEIAQRLGGVTRNAVIGKAYRLGLSGRAPPSRPATPRREPKRLAVRARVVARPRPVVSPPVRAFAPPDLEGMATVVSIERRACRWPIGDPLQPGFTLCGRPAQRGPYCACHGEIAYRPAATRPPRDHLLKLAALC